MRWLSLAVLILAACDAGAPAGPTDASPGSDAPVVPADAPSPAVDAPPDTALPPIGPGRLRVIALDDETGLPMPARAVITAVPPTTPVRFDYDPTTGVCLNGTDGANIAPAVIGAPEGILLVAGDGTVQLPDGTYRVMVTRGPEWEAHTEEVAVDGQHGVVVTGSLRHSVDSRGWLSADMHIHTAQSFDCKTGLKTRVVSEVTVGVGLIVTTDHNVLSDLQPTVEDLGYVGLARAIVGDEFNFAAGHGGAYPMPYDGTAQWGGTVEYGIDWETIKAVSLEALVPKLRALPTNPAISVNHPRMGGDLGYFNNLTQYGPNGWWPPQPLASAGVFDGLELMNGYMHAPSWVAMLLRDWFFLLSTGHRIAAVGGADTHGLDDTRAGFPRTWLRLPTDDPAQVTGTDLADAVRAGRTFVSNGPFVRLKVNGGDLGDLVTVSGSAVTVDLTVDAPDWISVDTVRLFVNGVQVQELPVTSGARPLLQTTFQQAIEPGDGWIVAVASGPEPLPMAVIGNHEGGAVLPMAVTSPIYLDGNGDGAWTPDIANPDPGQLALFGAMGLPDFDAADVHCTPPPAHEPPLWADPRTWEPRR
jgi:hypothetical protein